VSAASVHWHSMPDHTRYRIASEVLDELFASRRDFLGPVFDNRVDLLRGRCEALVQELSAHAYEAADPVAYREESDLLAECEHMLQLIETEIKDVEAHIAARRELLPKKPERNAASATASYNALLGWREEHGPRLELLDAADRDLRQARSENFEWERLVGDSRAEFLEKQFETINAPLSPAQAEDIALIARVRFLVSHRILPLIPDEGLAKVGFKHGARKGGEALVEYLIGSVGPTLSFVLDIYADWRNREMKLGSAVELTRALCELHWLLSEWHDGTLQRDLLALSGTEATVHMSNREYPAAAVKMLIDEWAANWGVTRTEILQVADE
jgi:hypothetical protein